MATAQIREQIRSALKKLGPTPPVRIADHINVEIKKASYHMRGMLAAGELKAAGTSMDRRYALPDQKLPGASAKHKPKKDAQPKAQAPLFLPALTEDYRLVVVQDGGHHIFDQEQTQALADLLLTHFEV